MSSALLTVSRCLAVANVGVVIVLFLTAGTLIQEGRLEGIHGYAAIALHVSSGFLALALAASAWQTKQGWWAPAWAVVLFAYSFVQAYLGEVMTLYLHIPGALLVAALSVWLAVWLFVRRPDVVLT
jgi:type IV secretory pathway TraG/TraD family ATPase VirD4